jgi:hypothetical protein
MLDIPIYFTRKEGARWERWPLPSYIKPTSQQLKTHKSSNHLLFDYAINNYDGTITEGLLIIHSIVFCDGTMWDAINGFRFEILTKDEIEIIEEILQNV